jgi:N-acetylglucosamine-6-phosphate deacetylase
MTRILLAGADVVLPDRVASGLTLVLEGDRIVDLVGGSPGASPGDRRVDLSGHLVVPGFIDVHVHGVFGADALDGPGAVAAIANRLPRWGVTAFCPTTTACSPAALDACLSEVAALRGAASGLAARVLPAHLESNFLNPAFRGAQPAACLRTGATIAGAPGAGTSADEPELQDFTAAQILDVIDRRRADIGILTLAPEIDGGLDLVRRFSAMGIRVSLGHSGASYDEAQAAIAAGARGATHLFNRMGPMTHRDPGLAGAVLASEEVAAEIICDGHHVHPAMMSVAIAAKGTSRTLAISDGTAGSGLPPGSKVTLGGQPITVEDVARLADGTMAGSVITLDQAFARLVSACGLDLLSAAELCSTTPARELGLTGLGVIAPGAIADLAVLDARLRVVATWVGGAEVWNSGAA